MKKITVLFIFSLSLLFSTSIFAQPGTELINHDFEASDDGWTAGGSKSGMVFNRISDPFGVGSNCWSTNPFNNYNKKDGAYCTSGAVDMTYFTSMTFSVDLRYETEANYDGMNIYYSTDDFATMTLLGAVGSGTNWFNSTNTIDGIRDRYRNNTPAISSDPSGWSGDNSAWQTATIPIPVALEAQPSVKFRVYFGADNSVHYDGVAFDNVNITGTYTSPCAAPSSPLSSSITTTTATISWTAASPAPSTGYDYYYTTSATLPDVLTTPSGSTDASTFSGAASSLTPGLTYNFYVRSNCGSSLYSDWVAGTAFATTPLVPTITSFTPSNGCVNETVVVITGTNLGGTSAVTIGATAVASYTVDSGTQISATVGTGTTGVISVTNSAGSASSTGSFTFNGNATITTQPATALEILTGNSDDITVVSGNASSYQWQYSANGTSGWSDVVDATPTNVAYAGSTTATLTITTSTSISAGTAYYRCVLSCGSVATNNAVVTFVQYCDISSSIDDAWINGVTFNTISNLSTGLTAGGYEDYSATQQTDLLRGETYNLDVKINTQGAWTFYQTVWIDWNQDGDFVDAGEEYDLGTAYNVTNGSSAECPLAITVPTDAETGFIKMRIMSNFSSSGASCTSFTYGEVEDYGLNIDYVYNWAGTLSTAWELKDNWTYGASPTSDKSIIVPDVTNQPVITTDVTITDLTIDASADLTISSNFLTVTGATDINGTMNIGNGTVNADGVFDATTGTIDMTNANANLVLSSTVTSLGTLDDAEGTVTYDGGVQSVLSDTYNNLSIATAGTKSAANDIIVNGNLTTAATATCVLDLGVWDLNVGGDLTVGATDGLDLTSGNTLLTLDGTANQTITHAGSTGSELRFVKLDKTSGDVILASVLEIDATLTLTSGHIDASSFDLQIASAGTVSGGSDASHVKGTIVKTTASTTKFTFPLGDGTYYKSIAITPSSGTSNVWTAQYNNTVHPTAGDQSSGLDASGTNGTPTSGDIDHISTYEWWDIDNGGTGETAIIEMAWVSQNEVSVYADLRIAHFDGTDWDKIPNNAPSGTNTAGTLTSSSAVSTFSPFTLGSSSSTNVLPIELVSFSGEKKDNRNILNWTTASEINNAFFTVEKSYNGFDFEWVGRQEGTSPSTQIVNYSLTDYNILETINYYRLKQTDFDGKFEYSSTISIDNRVDDSFKEIIGRTNLLGQEVDEFYNGIVIVRYKDGTSQKFYQFK